MSTPLVLFKHIGDITQLQHLFSELSQRKGTVYVKENDQVIQQISAEKFSGFTLTCTTPQLHPDHQIFNTTICANFYIGRDSYYFESKGTFDGNYLNLEIKHLFFLQKRAHLRYMVPSSDKLIFENQWNGQTLFFSVKDLSTRGFRIIIPDTNPPYKEGDIISGQISHEGHFYPLSGKIKVLQQQGGQTLLGVEFQMLENITEIFLIDRISDYQRKAYEKNAA